MKRSDKFPELLDETWLRDQYETLGKSCPQIATELGCTSHLVAYRANQFGIKLRGRHGGRWEPIPCERCGEDFTPSSSTARFCSKECRLGTIPCEQCGHQFAARLPKKWQDKSGNQRVYHSRFCSSECHKEWLVENSAYQYVNAQGYVVLTTPTARPVAHLIAEALEILKAYAPEHLANEPDEGDAVTLF